jgi:hypothetical protein
MVSFTNRRQLSEFIARQEKKYKKEEKVGPPLTEKNFLIDLKRSMEVLFIDGIPIKQLIDFKNIDEKSDQEVQEEVDVMFKSIFKRFENISSAKKEFYERFLRLFLHQGYLYPSSIWAIEQVGIKGLIVENPKKKVEISFCEEALYIKVAFNGYRIRDSYARVIDEANPHRDFLIRGEAIYKIERIPLRGKGWMAKYSLLSSTVECKDQYKKILDTRNSMEKIVDFFTMLIKKLIENVNIDIKPDKFINSEFIFFRSKDGKSVDEVIINPIQEQANAFLA